MTADIPNPKVQTAAFGVEPGYAPFRLRQARYHALAEAVARFAQPCQHQLQLLDVGMGTGRTMRYIDAQPGTSHIRYTGADIFPYGEDAIYQRERWTVHHANLEEGLPFLDSQAFDIVLCEQVLEHMHQAVFMLTELARVLRPGGLIVLGVPIFPHGLHLIPQHVKPFLERLTTPPEKRRDVTHGHVHAFSLHNFQNLIRVNTDLEIADSRGFRIVSGGPLRVLEHYEWWYRFNRRLGATIPSWCVETQVIAKRPGVLALPQEASQKLQLQDVA